MLGAVIDKLLQPVLPREVCTVVQCLLVNHPLMFNVAGHMYIYCTPHFIEPPHTTFMATHVTLQQQQQQQILEFGPLQETWMFYWENFIGAIKGA